jgi:hypothetical protein
MIIYILTATIVATRVATSTTRVLIEGVNVIGDHRRGGNSAGIVMTLLLWMLL